MRKNYNIPLNDNSSMDISCSPQSGFMPNFLIGNNNHSESSFYSNQTKAQPLMHNIISYDKKAPITSSLKRHESYHGAPRNAGPPITTLRNKSPINPYINNASMTSDTSFYGNGYATPGKLNQSFRAMKPYENNNFCNGSSSKKKLLNSSLKDSEAYNSFLVKNEPTTCSENEFDNWVTVFGYQQTEARFVLSYFSEIGNIVEQKISNSGNWMHIQYESKMHAVAALNRNGRILNLSTMIGVKPCDDKATDYVPSRPMAAKPIQKDNLNSSRFLEEPMPINESNSIVPRDKFNCSVLNSSMRSLSQCNFPSPVKVEERPKGGLLSRAMSMVFRK